MRQHAARAAFQPYGPTRCLCASFVGQQPQSGGRQRECEATRHASGQNYVLASPEGIVDVEVGAASVTRYRPDSLGGSVFHTNHVLAGPFAEDRPAASDDSTFAGPRSTRRFEAMARFLRATPQPDLAGIKRLLASDDGPICAQRVAGRGFTFGACIMTLGPDPQLHVTQGPPTTDGFVVHGL